MHILWHLRCMWTEIQHAKKTLLLGCVYILSLHFMIQNFSEKLLGRQESFLGFKTVPLCSPCCPGTRSVVQAGHQIRDPPASASVLGLRAWATTQLSEDLSGGGEADCSLLILNAKGWPVTLLFQDFTPFTSWSQKMAPHRTLRSHFPKEIKLYPVQIAHIP